MKKLFNHVCTSVFVFFALSASAFAANDADEIFDPLTQKVDGLAEGIRLFGWVVAGLVLVGCAIAAFANKFPKEKLLDVAKGCALLIAGTQLVAYLAS